MHVLATNDSKISRFLLGRTYFLRLLLLLPINNAPDALERVRHRPVEVKFTDGKWGVRSFMKLTSMVQTGAHMIHRSLHDDGHGDSVRPNRMNSEHGQDVEVLVANST
jgi:hypothetical protein